MFAPTAARLGGYEATAAPQPSRAQWAVTAVDREYIAGYMRRDHQAAVMRVRYGDNPIFLHGEPGPPAGDPPTKHNHRVDNATVETSDDSFAIDFKHLKTTSPRRHARVIPLTTSVDPTFVRVSSARVRPGQTLKRAGESAPSREQQGTNRHVATAPPPKKVGHYEATAYEETAGFVAVPPKSARASAISAGYKPEASFRNRVRRMRSLKGHDHRQGWRKCTKCAEKQHDQRDARWWTNGVTTTSWKDSIRNSDASRGRSNSLTRRETSDSSAPSPGGKRPSARARSRPQSGRFARRTRVRRRPLTLAKLLHVDGPACKESIERDIEKQLGVIRELQTSKEGSDDFEDVLAAEMEKLERLQLQAEECNMAEAVADILWRPLPRRLDAARARKARLIPRKEPWPVLPRQPNVWCSSAAPPPQRMTMGHTTKHAEQEEGLYAMTEDEKTSWKGWRRVHDNVDPGTQTHHNNGAGGDDSMEVADPLFEGESLELTLDERKKIKECLRWLNDPTSTVRIAACRSLSELARPAEAVHSALTTIVLTDPSPDARVEAAKALFTVFDANDNEVLSTLFSMLDAESDREIVRDTVVVLTSGEQTGATVEALCAFVGQSRASKSSVASPLGNMHFECAVLIARFIGNDCQDSRVVTFMEEVLNNSRSDMVCRRAARALVGMSTRAGKVTKVVVSLLKNAPWPARIGYVELLRDVLAYAPGPVVREVVSHLVLIGLDDPQVDVRKAACVALDGHGHGAEVFTPLFARLKGSDKDKRLSALDALLELEMGGTLAEEATALALKDASQEVRAKACDVAAAGKFRLPLIRARLHGLLEDESTEVAAAARRSFDILQGEETNTTPRSLEKVAAAS